MASFPFRRRPRDPRENPGMGLYAEAPDRRGLRADLRFSPHDWTTLWGAAALGYADLVDRMLDGGSDIEARDPLGDTALIFAASFRRYEVARLLLERGADVNGANRHGHTPLLIAAAAEDRAITALLRAWGARVGFLEAVVLGDADRAARLPVGYNTDLDAAINGHETPLIFAARRGRDDLVRLLLERGARIDLAGTDLGTPPDMAARAEPNPSPPLPPPPPATSRPTAGQVYEAASCRDEGEAALALRWLALQGGAGVFDTPDEDGETALHRAARRGDAATARRLLDHGANPQIRNRAGRTAADLAQASGHAPLAALLADRA